MIESGKHVKISGRVQGVGFRHFTMKNAQDLNIKGWVKNMRDGTVEAVIAGAQKNIEEMVDRLKEGPRTARVDSIEKLDEEIEPSEYSDFSIRR